MPTSAQLQAESYWDREIVTAEMDWLGDELCRRTKRPRSAAGTKGDTNHLRGAHRSQEWIQRSRYATSRTYTVQSGLTGTQLRHIAGFDFTPGSVEQMIAQSRRLMAEVKAGRLEGVTEIFCNVDGDKVVDGWDNVRNKAATSDSSHLWHWHLSIDRRHCADRALMERILAIALGDEDDMAGLDDKYGWGTSVRDAIGDLWWATFRGNVLSVEQRALARLEAQLAGVSTLLERVVALPGGVPLTSEQLAGLTAAVKAAAAGAVDELGERMAEADRARADALDATPGEPS